MGRNKFEITDTILKAALFGSHECGHCKIKVPGYIYDDREYLSRALLTHLVNRLFNIQRVPGYEESYLRNTDKMRSIFKSLSPAELDGAYSNLKELYSHTQDYIKDQCDGEILLYRNPAPFERAQMYKQLLNRRSVISFYNNTISSYTFDKTLFPQIPIQYKIRVSAEDILMHYRCLSYPWDCCNYFDIDSGKEDEVLVVNRDLFGRMEIPIEDFEWDDKKLYNDSSCYERSYFYDGVAYKGSYRYSENESGCKKPCESLPVKLLIKFMKAINN